MDFNRISLASVLPLVGYGGNREMRVAQTRVEAVEVARFWMYFEGKARMASPHI